MTELEIISDVIKILSGNAKCKARYASELDNFENRKIQASSNKYRLGVIGVTSSGKSTMINALLGEFLLPAVARPSSSQLVSCFRSPKRYAQVFFHTGKPIFFSSSSLTSKIIEKYADEEVNKKNKEKVKQIEISTPDFPFNDNIILIDSPGLDAYGYVGHEQLTMNSLLPTIDFCIFVTTCKTNSDEKMLSVLNTIAEYEKPVIIVQNMIDSIKPSLDGKKSVSEVAQEHRTRVERIVNRSDIKDKSKVRIVQISAINALKARQNRLRTKEDVTLLSTSNYKELVAKVDETFNQIRPVVEGHRMTYLKKEILRIAKAAAEDGAGDNKVPTEFKYEGITADFENKKNACIRILERKLNAFLSEISSLRNRFYLCEDDITNIINESNECEKEICNQMRILNASLVNICKELNIDSRDIISDFRFDKGSLHLKKKKEVVREGYWEKGKRILWGLIRLTKDKWIDPVIVEMTDVEGTKQNAIDYIHNTVKVFKQTIGRWQKSIEKTALKLFAEIDNRRSEFKARREKALDCQAYLQISKDLQKIADSIRNVDENSSKVIATRTEVKDSKTYNIHVNKELLPLFRLSDLIRIRIHNDIIKYFIPQPPKNIVIGWDEYCESSFLRYSFNKIIDPNKIVNGRNHLTESTNDSIIVIHKPTASTPENEFSTKNVFVLVNATQFGSAMNEIARYQLSNILSHSDRLYFIVQDLKEVINGDAVSETLDNIVSIKDHKELNINSQCNILLLHDNPVYNLAAAEAQATGCIFHSDEIRIMDDIQKRFFFLLPNDKTKKNQMETTIRLIIQKLGKI